MKRSKEKKNTRARGGFTLIEVLLVVAILGILAAVVVVNLPGRQKSAMIKTTRASIQGLSTAIDVYEIDTGRYPPSLESLIKEGGEPNWQGPYIKGGLPADAWGTAFRYEKQEKGYKIISAGPDLSFNTEDDITSF